MCSQDIADVVCHQCQQMIIVNKAVVEENPCVYVSNNGKEFGGCGHVAKRQVDMKRATESHMICSGCKDRARQASQNLYANLGARLTENREREQRRDDERRAGAEARSQSSDHGVVQLDSVGPPRYGAGMDWHSYSRAQARGEMPPGRWGALLEGDALAYQTAFDRVYGLTETDEHQGEAMDEELGDYLGSFGDSSGHNSGGGHSQSGDRGRRG